jgi:hypothetical protein
MRGIHVFIGLTLLVACASSLPNKDAEKVNTTGAFEILIKPDDDVAAIFKALPSNVQKITFSPGRYQISETLNLPRTGGLVIIEGNGAYLKLASGITGFYSMPSSKKEAMQYNHTRYLIQNFSTIEGGNKGVLLGSSFNTVIRNIEFAGQREAAVDLVFCLMSTLENLLVTNNFHDGIVLRSGEDVDKKQKAWEGSGLNNAQCNHTVVRQCRVYNRKECTGTSFKVLQNSGVRLVDCISEGFPNEMAVYFDAYGAATAKYFVIENFHLEHLPRRGGLCFRGFGNMVEVNGFFVQMANKESPVIRIENNGSYVFRNVPYWPGDAWVASSNAPSVVLENCVVSMYKIHDYWVNMDKQGEKVFEGYFKKGAMIRP